MTNTTSPSSFYNQGNVIYTEDNPAAPADTPITGDNTNAPSSFYKGTGEGGAFQYNIAGTSGSLTIPAASTGALGGVYAINAVAHKWIAYIDTTGTPQLSQPSFSDISGSVAASQMPALTGDVTSTAGTVATTVSALHGYPVSNTAPTTGYVLEWNGSAWAPAVSGTGTVTNVATGAGVLGGPITTTGTLTADPAYYQGFLAGLQLSNDGTSPNSVIDVSAGVCVDSTSAHFIKLGAFTKSTAGAWASGSGSHGMGNGLTVAASTWYHVHAILLSSGATDFYFDTSVTAANAPSGTIAYRRLGSIQTDASAHILAFSQNGDEFLWAAVIQEDNGSTASTTPTLASLVGIPTGVKVSARLRGIFVSSAVNGILLQSPDEASAQANATTGNADAYNVAGTDQGFNIIVRVNTSAQVRISAASSSGTNALYFDTYGWIDRRGRDG